MLCACHDALLRSYPSCVHTSAIAMQQREVPALSRSEWFYNWKSVSNVLLYC
jgi:hypothetical protein